MSGERQHDLYDRRRGRNLAVAGAILGLAALIFTVTVVKLQENSVNPFKAMSEGRSQP